MTRRRNVIAPIASQGLSTQRMRPMSIGTHRVYSLTGPDRRTAFSLSVLDKSGPYIDESNRQIDSYNVLWIREGDIVCSVDFATMHVRREALLFLSPGQILAVQSGALRSGYLVSFTPDFYCLERHGREVGCNGFLFNNITDLPLVPLESDDIAALERTFESLLREVNDPGLAHEEMLRTFLQWFLIEATRIGRRQRQPSVEETPEHVLFRQYNVLVEKHFRTYHTVQEYAAMLFIAPKTLAKKFNELGRKSPLSLIADRIVLEAKRELAYTDKSVQEIAYGLGYDDPAYFSRFFRKEVGIAPLDFRRDFRKRTVLL